MRSSMPSPFKSPSRPILERVEQLQQRLDVLTRMVNESDSSLVAEQEECKGGTVADVVAAQLEAVHNTEQRLRSLSTPREMPVSLSWPVLLGICCWLVYCIRCVSGISHGMLFALSLCYMHMPSLAWSLCGAT